MSGLRFKVGELARVVVSRGPHSNLHLHDVVEITGAGDLADCEGNPCDYSTRCSCIPGTAGMALMDWQLQKIDHPREPEAMTRTEETEVTV